MLEPVPKAHFGRASRRGGLTQADAEMRYAISQRALLCRAGYGTV